MAARLVSRILPPRPADESAARSRSRSPSTTCRSTACCRAGNEEVRLRARHRQGVQEAPHPALVRIHRRKQTRARSRRRAALRIWVDGGHPLGNHTYTHLDLTKNSAEDFQREILRNEPVLELLHATPAAGGTHDWRWFRYPYPPRGRHARKAPRGARLPVAPTVTASRRPRSTSRTTCGTAPTRAAGSKG